MSRWNLKFVRSAILFHLQPIAGRRIDVLHQRFPAEKCDYNRGF